MSFYTKELLDVRCILFVPWVPPRADAFPLAPARPPGSRTDTQAHINETLALRLEGNDKLLAGDLKGALKTYHLVLFALRGLDSPIQNYYAFGKSGEDSDDSDSGEEEDEEGSGGGGGGADDKQKSKGEATVTPSQHERVKSAILNTYLNMAKIYVEQEQWQKALRAADSAKRLHSDHPKAVFREAQARLGLGEIYTGRKMLQNLQKKHPDSAITAALQKLDLHEKARQQKADAQFRGIFAAKSKTFGKKKKQQTEDGSHGKITEIPDDRDAGAQSKAASDTAQPAPRPSAGPATDKSTQKLSA
ncbi:hypothetical protein JCM3774_000208 [Rhodotorula dairenensis]